MRVVASIQARMNSTRLPGKVLLHLGSRRVLEWVVDRCQQAPSVDETVIAVGDRPENEAIIEWCTRNSCKFLQGPEDDLLERHRNVAEEFEADVLVRLTGDCPFVPPDEIDRVYEQYTDRELEYAWNGTDRCPIGIQVDVINPIVFDRLQRDGHTHPVSPLRSVNEYNTWTAASEEWEKLREVHLAVDTPTDYWYLLDAIEAVGSEPQDVARWLAET